MRVTPVNIGFIPVQVAVGLEVSFASALLQQIYVPVALHTARIMLYQYEVELSNEQHVMIGMQEVHFPQERKVLMTLMKQRGWVEVRHGGVLHRKVQEEVIQSCS